MSSAPIPALRLVLRAMLDDATYPEHRKSRAWVEERLHDDHWTPERQQGLARLALRWVSTQRDAVGATLRHALGEELNAQEEAAAAMYAQTAQDAPGSTIARAHGG